jgi:uncharacterized protein (DUF58 family)
MAEESPFLGEQYLARLERLRLHVRKSLAGHLRADRRSRRLGSSLEFADYRNYASGDDPRRIDWSIYGRLDRLMTKLYEEEEDLEVTILVDSSASMRWKGQGEKLASKWTLARQVAAALAYLGLQGLDRIGLCYFDSSLRAESGLFRGRQAFASVVRFLQNPPASGDGGTDLAESLSRFVRRNRRPGLAIVLSDCLDPAGYERGLSAITNRHFALHLVHLFHPQECDPEENGDLLVRDSETGVEFPVTGSPALRIAYQQEVRRFREGLKTWCSRRSAGYSFLTSDVPFEDVIWKVFRQDRLLR